MLTLLANILDTAASAAPEAANALPAALRISGIALITILIVMGLFGAMISLLGRVFPDKQE